MIKQKLRDARSTVRVRRTNGQSPKGVPLPPVAYRMGGEHFAANEAFVVSALADVARLVDKADLNESSRLLDWGCGAGRLAVGVAEKYGRIAQYRGVDVQKPLIEWAQRHLGSRAGFDFVHVDLANARYNPDGSSAQQIPGDSGAFDVFYAYSVFSHLSGADSAAYMREIARLLAPGGRAFVTAFIERGVPDEVENPDGYGPMDWSGPLHCVRFDRDYFESFIEDAGLVVRTFEHGGETDGQSLYILER